MGKKNKFLRLLICFHFFLSLALKSMSFFTAARYFTQLSAHFKNLKEVNDLYNQDPYQIGKLFFVSSSAAILTSAFLNRKESFKKALVNTPKAKLFLFAGAYFLETYFSLKKYRLSQKFYGYRNADGKSLLLFSFNFRAANNKESIISSIAEEVKSNNIKRNLKEESSFSFNSSSVLKTSPLILPVLDSSMKRDPNEEALNRENSFKKVQEQKIPDHEILLTELNPNLLPLEEQVNVKPNQLDPAFKSPFSSAISSIPHEKENKSNPGSNIFEENPEDILNNQENYPQVKKKSEIFDFFSKTEESFHLVDLFVEQENFFDNLNRLDLNSNSAVLEEQVKENIEQDPSAHRSSALSEVKKNPKIFPHPPKINEFFSNPQYQEKKECYPAQTNSPALNILETLQEVYQPLLRPKNISWDNNDSLNHEYSLSNNSNISQNEIPGEFFEPENSFERINRNIPSSDISRELENLDDAKSKKKEILAAMKKAFKAAVKRINNKPIILPRENIKRLLSLERALREPLQPFQPLKPHL